MTDKHLVININKPKGMTSQQAVTKVKHIFTARKAGHAGTLDPIATGILLICTDEATKITRFLADVDKEYIALLKLGERTDTLDSEGKIIEKVEHFSMDGHMVKSVLEHFKGTIEQTPPMYSAIKVSGQPLYKLARKGIEVERPRKTVNIYELEMIQFAPPFLEIRALCSKGTYIRTLCDDIGTALGVGAHVVALKRIRIGDFRIEDSAELNELPNKGRAICSIDTALKHFKDLVLTHRDFLRAIKGVPIRPEDLSKLSVNAYLRLKNPDGKLFAIGKATGAAIKIERLLNVLS